MNYTEELIVSSLIDKIHYGANVTLALLVFFFPPFLLFPTIFTSMYLLVETTFLDLLQK